jgi:hypothetical protein
MSGQLCDGGPDRRTSLDIYVFIETDWPVRADQSGFRGPSTESHLRSPNRRKNQSLSGLHFHHGPPAPHSCSADGLIDKTVRFGDGLHKNERLQQQSSSRPISGQQLTDLLIPPGTSIADMFSNSLTRLSSFANGNCGHRPSWKCLAA